jgi:hypothetical protein
MEEQSLTPWRTPFDIAQGRLWITGMQVRGGRAFLYRRDLYGSGRIVGE